MIFTIFDFKICAFHNISSLKWYKKILWSFLIVTALNRKQTIIVQIENNFMCSFEKLELDNND
jgi:hypothetical protein